MRHQSKVSARQLHLELLEDRIQLSTGLFVDPLAADPLGGPSKADSVAGVAVLSDVGQETSTEAVLLQPPAATVPQVEQSPQASVQAENAGATLQLVVNAGAGSATLTTPRGQTLSTRDVSNVTYTATVTTPASPLIPVDPSHFTLKAETCGEEAGTESTIWSQYRGDAGVELNFRVDATDTGVVYSAGVGTDTVTGDNPGSVTRRTGSTCNTALIGTTELNFFILYGVNVSPAGGSVYTAGFDVYSGIAYVFKLAPDLSTIEEAVQSPSLVSLNFFFDIVNDSAGNRYVVGMTQNGAGTNGVRITKFNSNLTVPAVYDSLVIFTDGPGGPQLNSFGLSLDVTAAGVAYAGGGIAYGANDVKNVILNLNAAGNSVVWSAGFQYGPTVAQGPNGGTYGVSVEGGSVYGTGIIADEELPTEDNLLLAKRTLAGAAVAQETWHLLEGGDIQGYGIDVSSDGMPLVAGAMGGPEVNPDIDAFVIKYGTALDTVVGNDFFGNLAPNPASDDDAYGIALIGSDPNADFALAGDTTSSDFAPIIDPCAGENTFGGIIDGFMARYAQPLL